MLSQVFKLKTWAQIIQSEPTSALRKRWRPRLFQRIKATNWQLVSRCHRSSTVSKEVRKTCEMWRILGTSKRRSRIWLRVIQSTASTRRDNSGLSDQFEPMCPCWTTRVRTSNCHFTEVMRTWWLIWTQIWITNTKVQRRIDYHVREDSLFRTINLLTYIWLKTLTKLHIFSIKNE